MVVEGKCNKFHLQPRIGKNLNLFYHLNNQHTLSLKSLLFLSFQISHTVTNHITCKIERHTLDIPPLKLNWLKWSDILNGAAAYVPIHLLMKCQIDPKILQYKNKWFDVSVNPQPDTQSMEAWSRTPRRWRLSFVGNLSFVGQVTNCYLKLS